jgi:hypothetical protein
MKPIPKSWAINTITQYKYTRPTFVVNSIILKDYACPEIETALNTMPIYFDAMKVINKIKNRN